MRGVLAVFLLFSMQVMSQTSMDAGFQMLENQKYQEAEGFFEKILKDDVNNKTAQICLARAKGLGGDATAALNILKNLAESNPNDLEVNLNIAEAQLWNKNPALAAETYTQILESDSLNFTANFGKANALSSLKRYDDALIFINKTLSLDPNNTSAKTSKRYILYGVADTKRKQLDYKAAIAILDKVLEEHRNDEQALINKGICYLSMKDIRTAEWIFNYMQDRDINKFESALLLSHINLIKHNNKNALSFSEQGISLSDTDAKLLRASVQKVNVLGASKDFKSAHKLIDELEADFGKNQELILARGRMHIWDQDYKKGLENYNAIDDSSYVLHMGLAEAYRAKKQNLDAMAEIKRALVRIPNQPDALGLLHDLDLEQSPKFEVSTFTSSDIGKNLADNLFAKFSMPIKQRHRLILDAGIRETRQELTGVNAQQISFLLGDHWQINHRFSLKASGGLIQYTQDDQANGTGTLINISTNYQLTKNHSIGLNYVQDALKYSSDLIRSGIFKNSLVANYLFSKHKWPSFYLQYDLTNQTDDNNRKILFTSLFYQFKTFPLIKSGFNYTNMTYSTARPLLYFSPDSYKVLEVFVHFGNDFNMKSKFVYHFEYTFGKQKVSTDPQINATRISAEMGYRFSDRIKLTGQYFYSTAANTTNKGFSFTRYTLKLSTVL